MDKIGAQIHTPSLWAIPQTPPSQKAQSPLKHSDVMDSQKVRGPRVPRGPLQSRHPPGGTDPTSAAHKWYATLLSNT